MNSYYKANLNMECLRCNRCEDICREEGKCFKKHGWKLTFRMVDTMEYVFTYNSKDEADLVLKEIFEELNLCDTDIAFVKIKNTYINVYKIISMEVEPEDASK